MNPHLLEYVTLARESGAKTISVVSNGVRLADPLFAESLLQAGVNEIRLSLHGSRAEIHDGITRTPGSFAKIEQAVKNLTTLRAQGKQLRLMLLCVLCTPNLADIPNLLNLARGWDVDHLGFHPVEPVGLAENKWGFLVPRLTDVTQALRVSLVGWELEDPLSVTVDSIPYCIAHGLVPFLGKRMVIQKASEDGEMDWEGATRRNLFGPPCRSCDQRVFGHCEGVSSAYAEHFGWAEFGWGKPTS